MVDEMFYGRRSVLDRLLRRAETGKLGQPLLLSGPEGCGKEATALEFARRLNCVQPETCEPGARCESCAKALTFQHPDIMWIGPAPATVDEAEVRELLAAKTANPFQQSPWAATAQIGIGDPEHPGPLSIRAVIRFLRRRAFQGRYKVVVAADCQRLNTSAANAFLKTLEEPPAATVILLLTTGTEGMLPTIVSRCQKIVLEPWPHETLVGLLRRLGDVDADTAEQAARLAGGNARRALHLLEPEARLLTAWATQLFAWIGDGDRAMAAVAADELHAGRLGHACLPAAAKPRDFEVKDLGRRRDRAIRLCELLNLHYSDAVACRELADRWVPRLPAAAATIRAQAARRLTATLLRDMMSIDDCARDIDRNLNIGLVMAALCEGLIDHAGRDQRQLRTATG